MSSFDLDVIRFRLPVSWFGQRGVAIWLRIKVGCKHCGALCSATAIRYILSREDFLIIPGA